MQTDASTTDLIQPKEKDVHVQLTQILSDEEFKRSQKISRFLKYVVEETLKGKQQYLKAHSIAVAIFGKDENFDPQVDPVVRVNAVRLRRMLQQYYSTTGNKDNVIIDIMKGSYVPQFYFAKNSKEILNKLTSPSKGGSFPSVAVLNFKNLSGNLSYDYFADGITQEIVSRLCTFKEILVVARSSTNINENHYINTMRLIESADVRYALSGSIRIDNKNIRINVELDDTSTQTIVWSHEYDKKLSVNNMISIQDEIATHVAITIAQPYGVIIRKELAELHRSSTTDLTAYQLFLHFYQWGITLSPSDHLKARDALEQAVKIDPNFSDAWTALALIYNTEYQLSCNLVKREKDVRDIAFDAAQRAIKTDPDNARAHYALLFVNMVKYGTRAYLEKAEKTYQLFPHHSLFIAVYGVRLAFCGEWERGLELIQEAMVLSPSHPDFYHVPIVLNYYRQEMYEYALYEARKVNMPESFIVNMILAALYSDMGEDKHAKRSAKQLLDLYPNFEENARFELEKWDMQTDLKEKLVNSLKFAGLKIS